MRKSSFGEVYHLALRITQGKPVPNTAQTRKMKRLNFMISKMLAERRLWADIQHVMLPPKSRRRRNPVVFEQSQHPVVDHTSK
jgi:hypothetical protein